MDQNFLKDWRSNKSKSGGGILLDQGIHMLDLFLYLGGNFDQVKSFVSNLFWDIPGIEDNVFAIFKNSVNGICASLHSTMTQWRYLFSLELFLEKGSLILNGLKTATNSSLTNVTAEVIGSGLFLHGSRADSTNFLGGAVNENMSVIGQKAQDISRLPAMCKQGYVAQISNAADLDTDDYYVKFIADNGVSGAGSWEECVRPHNLASGSDPMLKGLDTSTMPHALINNRNGTFTFAELTETFANSKNNDNYWKNREVGDDTSNPFPTFKGAGIQKIFFHRNRLGLIAGENVVMSQPGGYFNFFIVSFFSRFDLSPF